MNIFHSHHWEIIGKEEFTDTSFGLDIPKTNYHLRCSKCGRLKDKSLCGWVK